jgi:putative methylase
MKMSSLLPTLGRSRWFRNVERRRRDDDDGRSVGRSGVRVASRRVASRRVASRRVARMRVRQLESLLSDLAPFAMPKQNLEQYPTNAELAAGVLHHAMHAGDVGEGKTVVDLGVGCGMLSIAAVLCEASHVTGVDVDEDALETCRENLEGFEPALEVDLVLADVIGGCENKASSSSGTSSSSSALRRLRADTVLMNPPFGTRRKGADVAFLRAGFRIATGAIYSLHKSSTREHIEKVARTRFHAKKADVLAQLKYDLPATYAHHREKSVEIAVDLWRFVPDPDAVIEDPTEGDADFMSADDLAGQFSSKARVSSGRGRGGGGRGRRR